MAFDQELADRVRVYLAEIPSLDIEEKRMFGGLAFMVNGKMCVNVSQERLMCRFDPKLEAELVEREGYEPMIMKNRVYKGYCYVHPEGYEREKDFEFWMKLCLDYNPQAKSSKK